MDVAATTRPARSSAREALLDRVVKCVADSGLPPDISLRALARVIGTSCQLLVHHFGTKDRLLAEVLQVLRLRQQEFLSSTAVDWGRRDALLTLWSYYADPGLDTTNRAFYYLLGRAVHDPSAYADFVESMSNWVAIVKALGIKEGLDADDAEVQAYLIIGSIRGLVLDRLMTGQRKLADQAFYRLLDQTIPPPRPKSERSDRSESRSG